MLWVEAEEMVAAELGRSLAELDLCLARRQHLEVELCHEYGGEGQEYVRMYVWRALPLGDAQSQLLEQRGLVVQ